MTNPNATGNGTNAKERRRRLAKCYEYLLSLSPPNQHESEPADDGLGPNIAASSQVERSALADGTVSINQYQVTEAHHESSNSSMEQDSSKQDRLGNKTARISL